MKNKFAVYSVLLLVITVILTAINLRFERVVPYENPNPLVDNFSLTYPQETLRGWPMPYTTDRITVANNYQPDKSIKPVSMVVDILLWVVPAVPILIYLRKRATQ